MLQKLYNREIGAYITPYAFALEASGTESGSIHRLRRKHELVGHDGCVNTVCFTPDGSSLLSGSDDRIIRIWDWEKGECGFYWESQHTNNIFQARLIGAGDKTVVSSAADGQVRLHLLSNSGRVTSKKVGQHEGRAHKLALDPSQIHCFYSSGEDAVVRHYDVRQRRAGCEKLLTVFSTVTRRRNEAIDLNSIHVNPAAPHEFVAAGDEEWAYVYDARMIRMQRQALQVTPTAIPVAHYCPRHLMNEGRRAFAHITACAFSRRGELLLSYSGDGIFLFHPWLKGQAQRQRCYVEETAWKRQRNRSDNSQAEPPKRTRKGYNRGKWHSSEPVADCMAAAEPNDLPQPARRAPKCERRRHAGAGPSLRDDADGSQGGASPSENGTGQFAAPDLLRDNVGREDRSGAAASPEDTVSTRAGGQAGSPQASGSTEDSGSELQRSMDDANNAAEELLRGLFEDAVVNGFLRRRAAQHDAADSHSSLAQPGGSDTHDAEGLYGAPLADSSDDGRGWEPWGDDDGSGPEEEAEDEEDDDDEDEDDSADFGEQLDQGDLDGELWSSLNATGHQKPPQTPQPHCLGGFEHERDSKMWLHAADDCVVQRFDGHRNLQTVKGVSFLGLDDEFIASGSDCGHLFVWSKRDGRLRRMLHGDSHVLNCVEPHPHQPLTVATSGIDNDIKMWTAEAHPELDVAEAAVRENVEGLEAVVRSNRHRQSSTPLGRNTFLPFLLHFRQLQQLG
eukprot:jgi/Ulvmu1/4957/UM207_0001.1